MDNYDFIERRIRFLRWVFSKEEPWRNFLKMGKTLADKLNNDFKETLTNTTFDFSANAYRYSSTANSSYTYLPTVQNILKIVNTANTTASVNSSIAYSVP